MSIGSTQSTPFQSYSGSGESDSESYSASDSEDSSAVEYANSAPNLLPKGKEPVNDRRSVTTRGHLLSSYTDSLDSESSDNEETIRLQATRQATPAVVMYNDLGGGFRKDAVVSDARLKQSVQDAFRALKVLVATGDEKVQVDVDNRIVWIYRADGTATTKNLNELVIANPQLETCAQTLIDLARQVWPDLSRNPTPPPGCKAPDTAQPVRPSHLVPQNITSSYSTCAKLALKLYSTKVTDSTKQDNALKRITAVESIINQMQKVIDAELRQERTNLSTAAAGSAAAQRATAAIASLEKYSNVNRLGLYVAAAFAPSTNLRDPKNSLVVADQAAKNIQEVLQTHLDDEHKKMVNEGYTDLLPESFLGNGAPRTWIPKDEAYAKWAGALVYSMLPEELARKGAANYWLGEKASPFKDSVEDDLMKKLAPAPAVPRTTPSLDEMFNTVQARQVPAFTHTLQTLQVAAEAILNRGAIAGATLDAKVDAMNTQHNFA